MAFKRDIAGVARPWRWRHLGFGNLASGFSIFFNRVFPSNWLEPPRIGSRQRKRVSAIVLVYCTTSVLVRLTDALFGRRGVWNCAGTAVTFLDAVVRVLFVNEVCAIS